MRIAYIGLGSMGAPQARLLVSAGHELSVFDPEPSALTAFDGLARLAVSSGDAALGAQAVCICVRDDAQVADVVLADDGVLTGLVDGGLILIHSTIKAATLELLRDRLAGRGIALVDAPVSRTRRTDDTPFVYTMLGGTDADVTRARPIVEAFSTDVDHMGPLGAGMAVKIANNLVTWTQIIVGAQAVAIANAGGVAYDKLRGVMQANGNLTPTMGAMLDGKHLSPGPNPDRDAFLVSQAGIGEKDLALAIETASAVGIDPGMMAEGRRIVRDIMTGNPTG